MNSLFKDPIEETDAFRDEGIDFWFYKIGWPAEPKGKAFLGRVVFMVGEHMFPDEWTGNEPADRFLPWLPTGENAVVNEGWEERCLRDALERFAPDRHLATFLSSEDAIVGLDLYKTHVLPERQKSQQRISDVVRAIKQGLMDGALHAYRQHMNGGKPYVEMSDVEWTGVDVPEWFAFGWQALANAGPQALRSTSEADTLPSFVFIDECSLPEFIAQIAIARMTAAFSNPIETGEFFGADFGFDAVDPEMQLAFNNRMQSPRTTEGVAQLEAKARLVFDEMAATGQSPKIREFETRCSGQHISTTISRRVFKELNTEKPGPRLNAQ